MVVGVGFGARTLEPANIKPLNINNLTIGSGAFATLNDDTVSAYSVPAGKTCIIDLTIYNNRGSSTPDSAEFGFADDAAGTNYITCIPRAVFSNPTANTTNTTECLMKVAATKYPLLKSNATNTDIFLYVRGMEV